jgi:hypothetical protein
MHEEVRASVTVVRWQLLSGMARDFSLQCKRPGTSGHCCNLERMHAVEMASLVGARGL